MKGIGLVNTNTVVQHGH